MKKNIIIVIMTILSIFMTAFIIMVNNKSSSSVGIASKDLKPILLTTVCKRESSDKKSSHIVTLKSRNGEIISVDYESKLIEPNSEEIYRYLKKIYESRKKYFNTLEGVRYEYELTYSMSSERTSVDLLADPSKESSEEIDLELENYLFMINFTDRTLNKQLERLNKYNYKCE